MSVVGGVAAPVNWKKVCLTKWEELVFSYRQCELESIIAFADRSFRTDSLSKTGVPPIRLYRTA